MLACARIGAIHWVIFGGFSAEALVDRINDAEAKLVITADAGWRRGQKIDLKRSVDEALERCPTIQKCLVLKRVGEPIQMRQGRDIWWHELVPSQSPNCGPVAVDSEHTLYTLYTRERPVNPRASSIPPAAT